MTRMNTMGVLLMALVAAACANESAVGPDTTTTTVAETTTTTTVPTTTVATTTTTMVVLEPPESVEFHFGEDISTADRELTRTAVAWAWAEVLPTVGDEAPAVAVYVYSNIEELAQVYATYVNIPVASARELWEQGHAGMGLSGAFFLRDIQRLIEQERFMVVAHEFIHVIQSALSGKNALREPGQISAGPVDPRWINEGPAQYLAERTSAAFDLRPFSETIDEYLLRINGSRAELSSMEDWPGFVEAGDGYGIAFAAAHLLVQISDEEALLRYEANIGAGMSWQEAFMSSFGISVDEFYELFERYRDALADMTLEFAPTTS